MHLKPNFANFRVVLCVTGRGRNNPSCNCKMCLLPLGTTSPCKARLIFLNKFLNVLWAVGASDDTGLSTVARKICRLVQVCNTMSSRKQFSFPFSGRNPQQKEDIHCRANSLPLWNQESMKGSYFPDSANTVWLHGARVEFTCGASCVASFRIESEATM